MRHREAVAAAPADVERPTHRLEQHQAVGAAEHRLAGALGVRHQADDVAASLQIPAMLSSAPFGFAASVSSPGGVAVAEDDAARASSVASTSGGRRSSCLRRARSESAGPAPARHAAVNGVSVCSTRTCTCSQWNFRSAVAQHRAGQQPRLEQDLEAVADAEHRAAGVGERRDRGHDRREPRDRAGAQVVAVGEAARQDDDVGALRGACPCARRTRRPARARAWRRDRRRGRSWIRERRRCEFHVSCPVSSSSSSGMLSPTSIR